MAKSTNGRNEKTKKRILGGDASILLNQIVSKSSMGTSFIHNVYFYISVPLKIWCSPCELSVLLFCGTWKQTRPQGFPPESNGMCRSSHQEAWPISCPLELGLACAPQSAVKAITFQFIPQDSRDLPCFHSLLELCHCHVNRSRTA